MSVNSVSFKGYGQKGVSLAKSYGEASKYIIEKEMQKEVQALMPRPIQVLNKMKSFVGEVPNIIINALGTGLVAPVFIKYNFLSKADDETRTYSALRQPISAVLAVITQAGLLIPVNNAMDKMSNAGDFSNSKYNKSGFQEISYIENLVKKNNPALSKKQISEEAKAIQLSQLKPLMDNVQKNNTIQYLVKGKEVSIPESEFSTLLKEAVDDMHKHVSGNLKRYETEKIPNQVQRGEYFRTENSKVKATLETILKKVKTTTKNEELLAWMKSELKTLKSNKADSELITIVTEIGQRPDAATIKNKTQDVLNKCASFAECKSKEEVVQKISSNLKPAIVKMKHDKYVIKKMQNAIAKSIKQEATAEQKLAVSAAKLAEKAKTISNDNFIYDVVQKHIKNVNANVKGLKQMVGLGVSLAILPLTCSLLNNIYPKFMDMVFPELAKTKHSKEKDKLIKGCDHDVKTSTPEAKKQEVSK